MEDFYPAARMKPGLIRHLSGCNHLYMPRPVAAGMF
jgi:hypothetical protein